MTDDDTVERLLDGQRRGNLAWVQVDLAAGVAAGGLGAAMSSALRDVGPRRWWYVRKPPGVRVRVEAGGERDAVEQAVLGAVSPLGQVSASVYEPETFRFGGPEGMDVAHDQFSLDTALAVLVERDRMGALDWSAIALSDLATRVVDDHAELWDAWKRLEHVLAEVTGGSPIQRDRGADDERERPGRVPVASPRLASALVEGNRLVARRLRDAPLAHGVGRRTWFTAVAVFHWNRLGLGPVEMATVVETVLHELGGPA